MHPQTYGFASHTAGETIEAIDPRSLQAMASTQILSVHAVSKYEYELELEETEGFDLGFAVENVDRTAEVYIRHNHFERIPTRGILISTRKKVVIESNRFKHLGMSAILVSNDARGWYESGYVRDLLIQDNDFIDCQAPQILLWPEVDAQTTLEAVHDRIRVIANRVQDSPEPFIQARNISNLEVQHNEEGNGQSLRIVAVDCPDLQHDLPQSNVSLQ